jgi:hypothetical protein
MKPTKRVERAVATWAGPGRESEVRNIFRFWWNAVSWANLAKYTSEYNVPSTTVTQGRRWIGI